MTAAAICLLREAGMGGERAERGMARLSSIPHSCQVEIAAGFGWPRGGPPIQALRARELSLTRATLTESWGHAPNFHDARGIIGRCAECFPLFSLFYC